MQDKNREANLVILNWARPQNVRKIISKYIEYNCIKYIYLLDCNPNSENSLETITHDKVIQVKISKDPGLFIRFSFGAISDSKAVFIVDDDMLIPEETFNTLYDRWNADQESCYGIFGRKVRFPLVYSYRPFSGRVDMVLTKCLITSSENCAKTLIYSRQITTDLIGNPKGNGEDIVHSFVCKNCFADENLVYEKLEEGTCPISAQSGHLEHRKKVIQWCYKNIP
jgi:hypothetical protein